MAVGELLTAIKVVTDVFSISSARKWNQFKALAHELELLADLIDKVADFGKNATRKLSDRDKPTVDKALDSLCEAVHLRFLTIGSTWEMEGPESEEFMKRLRRISNNFVQFPNSLAMDLYRAVGSYDNFYQPPRHDLHANAEESRNLASKARLLGA